MMTQDPQITQDPQKAPANPQPFQGVPLPNNAIVVPPTMPVFQAIKAWFQSLTSKQKIALLTGTGLAALVAISSVSGTGKKKSERFSFNAPKANPGAVVNAGNQGYDQLAQNTELILNDFRGQVLQQESQRIAIYAQREVTKKGQGCYMKPVSCVFDRLELESIARLSRFARLRNWDATLAAQNRIDAIDLARSGTQLAAEPQVNTASLALTNRLQSRQQLDQASAEALSGDILRGNQP